MSSVPQYRTNYFDIIRRHNLSFLKIVALILYYSLFRYLPFCLIIRSALCKLIFLQVGRQVTVHKGASFGTGCNVTIGDYSSINRNCWISNDTKIGKDVMMGPEVIILSGSHNFDSNLIPMREQGAPPRRPVVIGDDVWIGTRSILLPGISVGSHSIIAAGSVVTKDVPNYTIVGGNPARIIRGR